MAGLSALIVRRSWKVQAGFSRASRQRRFSAYSIRVARESVWVESE